VHPLLFEFHLGSRELGLHTYGVLIALGFAIGIWLAVRQGRRLGLDGGKLLDLSFWMLVVGLVGSRIVYVAVNAGDFVRSCAGDGNPRSWGRLLSNCTRVLQVWEGGLVFYGGLIGATIVTLLFVRRERWSFWKVADVFAPSLALGHVFGRLGCFAAGCCFGKMCDTPWAVSFPHGSVAYDELHRSGSVALGARLTPPLHPTQLYEAAGELVIFVALIFLRTRKRFDGEVLLVYALGYATLRSVIEVFRGDFARSYIVEFATPGLARALGLPPSEPIFLSLAQGVSLLVAAAAITVLVRRQRVA